MNEGLFEMDVCFDVQFSDAVPQKDQTKELVEEFARNASIKLSLDQSGFNVQVLENDHRYTASNPHVSAKKMCVKELGPPIQLEDLQDMSEDEKLGLFFDDEYMFSAEDYAILQYSDTNLFRFMQSHYRTTADHFTFDCSAYGVNL
jgi:hypothetical protein